MTIERLMEGGNARYIDRETGEVKGFADKIDLKKIPRKVLIDEIVSVLSEINNLFKKKFGKKLWNNFNVVTSGKALNGSSVSLFNKDITDEEFVKHKPKVGDIDITFPGELMSKLWEFLNTIENKKLGTMTRYLGHRKSNATKNEVNSLDQINAIFEIDTGDYRVNVQIDFEASEYKDDEPTEWTLFSHNSDWADIQQGFKGVLHKFTLLNLARAVSMVEGVLFVTPTVAKKANGLSKKEYEAGKPFKVSKSKEFINPTNLAFSVDKGIRTKFTQVFHNDGEPLIIDGKMVFMKKDSRIDKYVTDLEKIFALIFNREPSDSDMNNFKSFIGVVKLMKKYLDTKIIKNFFWEQLVCKTLFCKSGCQGLERNDPEGDFEIKSAMINYLYDEFPYLKSYQSKVDARAKEYYDNYRMIEITDSLIIKSSSSFSAIFEQVEAFMESVSEPRGWRHFDKKRLIDEKIKILKKFNLSANEISDFINSASNSRIVNDVIRKIKAKRGLEEFLRWKPREKTITQKMIDNFKKGDTLMKLSELMIENRTNHFMESVSEPRGWRHFDKKRLIDEKIKILKKFNLSANEISDFINSASNSRIVNDVIRKIKAKRGLEEFLRWKPREKTITQKMIDNFKKGIIY